MATTIRNLKDHHFATTSKDLITLVFDDVILIFFDDHSEMADVIRPAFIEAGEKASGPVFAICDVKNNDEVATAFYRLRNEPNNPHLWAAQTFPFILTYRSGWPQAFYNGDIAGDVIRNYSMELAGQSNYYEKVFTPRQLTAPTENLVLPPGNLPTQNTPIKTKNVPIANTVSPSSPSVKTNTENISMVDTNSTFLSRQPTVAVPTRIPRDTMYTGNKFSSVNSNTLPVKTLYRR